jgi:translocator protein
VTALKPVSKIAIVIAIAVALSVIAIGRLFTDLGPWYFALKMPSWQPPGPAFGIIWTVIYALTTTSAVMVWRTIDSQKSAILLLGLFGINIFLNLMWSYLFFEQQRPDWALYQVGFFWLSILALIIYIWPKHKLAGLLLAPYLIWVGIATFLNLGVVQLNGPFV